ncbi:acetate--CoA ligase family protein [Xanthobacter autotrophicus DSM 431]|uniref:acetate--CoA ligase family protein n=1 Tax=Xanthobacter nonsaccharivorans TaxID=3119912 RepID=UPI0037271613
MTAASTSIADALFRPRSIALVGASGDENKHASLPHQYLRRHGYGGEIFPINANRDSVFGERAFKSVFQVGKPVDHAFIMLPTDAVLGAVSDCCKAGVRCATILSNGFAESGEEGRRRQADLLGMARTSGLRLLGPNSLGIINLPDHVALSANEILSLPELRPGRYSLISQSGSLIGAVLSRGQARGIGFAKMISVGNEADLGVAEMGGMLVDDPGTDAILLFLETVRNADGLAAMARSAFAAGKPVIAFRVGRSEVGEQLAATHTGAMVGSGAAMDAFLSDIGIVRVETMDAFLEVAPLVQGHRPPGGRRVSVVSTTGGGGTLVIDAIERHDIEIVPPSEAAVERLAAQGIAIARTPLIDLTLAGTNPRTYGAVLRELMAAPDCDLVMSVVGSSSQFRPDRAVLPITAATRENPGKPVGVFLTPHAETSLGLLSEAGLAAFRTPESCADALRAFFDWRAPRAEEPHPVPRAAAAALAATEDPLDAGAAARVFERLGVPVAAERVLPADMGAIEAEALDDLAYPVVAKILSPDIAHKTEVGGVVIGCPTPAALKAACRRILASVAEAAPQARLAGIQVQPMLEGIGEALLGYHRDPSVGPVVTLGVGGVLAEIYRDVCVRRAPVDEAAARGMIDAVRGLAPLRGYRGLQKGDLDALAQCIAAFSRLALLDVEEAEINPVLIRPEGQGVVALDTLLVKGGPHAS